ncbi:MAG: hypothetical protein P4L22_07800 [Candidatus Babeliales bacterium]|nr:hypothetical protein [Candidatus Babeliales bacterium]
MFKKKLSFFIFFIISTPLFLSSFNISCDELKIIRQEIKNESENYVWYTMKDEDSITQAARNIIIDPKTSQFKSVYQAFITKKGTYTKIYKCIDAKEVYEQLKYSYAEIS